MEEEIELNFRLDENGRLSLTSEESDGAPTASMDFQSKTTMTSLASEDVDALLFDCDIADCGLMPRTFWVPADGSIKPRCRLEQFALDVFRHHVQSKTKGHESIPYDPAKSGAEWWVQIRPSPEGTGRYSMHDPEHSEDDIARTGISWHWDKDEDLRMMMDGKMYLHPFLSTVTYLTDYGCPTMAVNARVHNLTGEWLLSSGGKSEKDTTHVEAYCSWPKTGKHLSFDGRYLHAALPNFMKPGEFDEQCRVDQSIGEDSKKKISQRRHRRVTFLVNVWLNFKPLNVHPFPDDMISKLSGSGGEDEGDKGIVGGKRVDSSTGSNGLRFVDSDSMITVKNAEIGVDGSVRVGGSLELTSDVEKFTWPMGDTSSGERLTAVIPISAIRSQSESGGDVRICWKLSNQSNTFSMFRESNSNAQSGALGKTDVADAGPGKRKVDEI